MLYRGRRWINTCFVSVFRQLFANHPQFQYKSDFLKSKIYIDESFPRGQRKFPEIICTDVTDGQFFQSSFDRNFQQDVYDESGELRGSIHGLHIYPTIRVSISALSKYDAEIISDYICSYMQYYGINKFADAGIVILNANGSTPQTEEYGKELIYTITLDYNLYQEWEKFVPIDDGIIEKIVIPNIDIVYPDINNVKEEYKEENPLIIEKDDENG